MTALTRCPSGVLREIPECWRMYRAIVEELAALGRAEGVDLSDDVVDRMMTAAAALPPEAQSSMAHDLGAGRRLELEALHGYAVRLGERHGVPTPATFAVYAALRAARRREARLTSPARAVGEYVLRYWGRYAVGVVALLCATGLALAIPATVKRAIDALEHDAASAPIAQEALIIVLLAAGQRRGPPPLALSAASAGRQRVEYDLRNDLYAALQAYPPAFYGAHRTGDLMARATSDITAVKSLVGFGLVSMVGTAAAFAGALAAMISVDPWLTAVGAPAVPGARPRRPRRSTRACTGRPRPCRSSSACSRAWCRST